MAAQTKTAAKPDIFAQKLVDEALTKHPQVIIIAMHVTPPGETEKVNLRDQSRPYSKEADEGDMRAIETISSYSESRVGVM